MVISATRRRKTTWLKWRPQLTGLSNDQDVQVVDIDLVLALSVRFAIQTKKPAETV